MIQKGDVSKRYRTLRNQGLSDSQAISRMAAEKELEALEKIMNDVAMANQRQVKQACGFLNDF